MRLCLLLLSFVTLLEAAKQKQQDVSRSQLMSEEKENYNPEGDGENSGLGGPRGGSMLGQMLNFFDDLRRKFKKAFFPMSKGDKKRLNSGLPEIDKPDEVISNINSEDVSEEPRTLREKKNDKVKRTQDDETQQRKKSKRKMKDKKGKAKKPRKETEQGKYLQEIDQLINDFENAAMPNVKAESKEKPPIEGNEDRTKEEDAKAWTEINDMITDIESEMEGAKGTSPPKKKSEELSDRFEKEGFYDSGDEQEFVSGVQTKPHEKTSPKPETVDESTVEGPFEQVPQGMLLNLPVRKQIENPSASNIDENPHDPDRPKSLDPIPSLGNDPQAFDLVHRLLKEAALNYEEWDSENMKAKESLKAEIVACKRQIAEERVQTDMQLGQEASNLQTFLSRLLKHYDTYKK